ncbi:hypothetical protein SBF1_450004 [Candidatus Desulfosporosinus infrequens]|uniref:Uncharacterized protein n=1 Tax=Candidatus Desulfosporosinus infrequens TaxID=2043169 RepID=A0A2U3LC60_9FIRM|nr:hypothetical protein SBF1_450004 [Candidatus Desulfosporosinus infrequens]
MNLRRSILCQVDSKITKYKQSKVKLYLLQLFSYCLDRLLYAEYPDAIKILSILQYLAPILFEDNEKRGSPKIQ